MTTPQLILEIKNRYHSMNPAMQKISDYLITNYNEAAALGIHEVAQKSGVSASSVTGFVKELGYKNYKALQLAMAVSIGQNKTDSNEQNDSPFIYGGVCDEDGMNEICQKVFRTNVQMLLDTLSIVDIEQMEKVGKLILKAGKVIFMGVGRSYLTAESGKNRFYRMGLDCHCYRDPHEQIVCASMCSKGDVVIAISNYGRSRSVIEATELARRRGAVTIGITGAKNSALANSVDYPFYSASNADSSNNKMNVGMLEPSSENITQIVLLDCLYMYVALKKKETIINQYKETTKELEKERV